MKNKISFKKVVSFLIAVVVLTCYIWGASEIISKFIKPSAPFEESFGNYKITLADSEIDPNDKNENRIFDNVNKSLFYNEQPEFSGKQILSLYKAENTSNKKDTKEQIKINIDKDIAKDESIEVVRINDKNECKKIDFKIIKETVDDKEQDYLVIDINESCIFGVLIERGEAEHTGAIVLSSIAIIAIIYLFAFILPDLKKKNKGKKEIVR